MANEHVSRSARQLFSVRRGLHRLHDVRRCVDGVARRIGTRRRVDVGDARGGDDARSDRDGAVPRARWSAARTLAAAGVVLSVGAAIPLFSTSLPAMILSALLFGAAMFTAPTAVTDLVKTSLPKPAWGPAVAVFTVVFAIGQSIGPSCPDGSRTRHSRSMPASQDRSPFCWRRARLPCASGKAKAGRTNPGFKEIQMEKRNVNVLLHLARPSVGNDIRALIRDLTRLAGVARVAPGCAFDPAQDRLHHPGISMRTLLARARRGWSVVVASGRMTGDWHDRCMSTSRREGDRPSRLPFSREADITRCSCRSILTCNGTMPAHRCHLAAGGARLLRRNSARHHISPPLTPPNTSSPPSYGMTKGPSGGSYSASLARSVGSSDSRRAPRKRFQALIVA